MGKRKKRRNKTKRESNHAITVEKPLINVQAQMETALVHEVEPKRSSILEGQDKKDIRHEQHPGNSNNRNLSAIFGGVIGALVVVIIIVFLSFIWPGFRLSKYYVNNDPSLLMGLLETSVTTSDSLAIANAINIETQNRQDLLADLLEQKVIVSSDEFASNLSTYYNALITVLAAILIILNLVGFFSWRSNANNALEQKQRELDDTINNVDDLLEKNLETSFKKNHMLRDLLAEIIQDTMDQQERLEEEEWKKLHLLLNRYQRNETLKAIEHDEQDNDGEIE